VISLGHGLPTLEECFDELKMYAEDLARYYDPDVPIGNTLDLLEVATAYLARAFDIERQLHQREQILSLPRGCPEQRFRTGALESFISQAKVCRDLGSRRLSFAQLRYDSEKTGREHQ
jgi:hypothetical protein